MKNILIIIFISIGLIACSNDDNPSTDVSNSDFYPLAIGNSWVHKSYSEKDGAMVFTGIIDSTTIEGTEEINGTIYFVFKTKTTGNDNNTPHFNKNGERTELLRDSLGFLIDTTGYKHYNSKNKTRLVNYEASFGTIFSQLITDETVVEVEAGTFSCIHNQFFAIEAITEELLPGIDQDYYAKKIGPILRTLNTASGRKLGERRLDSYSIK